MWDPETREEVPQLSGIQTNKLIYILDAGRWSFMSTMGTSKIQKSYFSVHLDRENMALK